MPILGTSFIGHYFLVLGILLIFNFIFYYFVYITNTRTQPRWSRDFNRSEYTFFNPIISKLKDLKGYLTFEQGQIDPLNLPMCPKTPKSQAKAGPIPTYSDSPSYEELEALYPEVSSGGRYKPSDCISRHRVAIIIPYRNRDLHLRTLLKNIHPFLQRQQLDYGIYIIEQVNGGKFNRAKLLNIGYAEAIKIYDYQCFVFHDVDLIPEDDRNLYHCPSQPRHLTAAIDKFNYKLFYPTSFGGGVILTKEQFQNVNGYSNQFFGWGKEDDDMWNRIRSKGYKVLRYPSNIARYKMIRHGRDKGNERNPHGISLLRTGAKRFATDGLNSLKYKVLKLEYHKLFTRILVNVNETEIMKNE